MTRMMKTTMTLIGHLEINNWLWDSCAFKSGAKAPHFKRYRDELAPANLAELLVRRFTAATEKVSFDVVSFGGMLASTSSGQFC